MFPLNYNGSFKHRRNIIFQTRCDTKHQQRAEDNFTTLKKYNRRYENRNHFYLITVLHSLQQRTFTLWKWFVKISTLICLGVKFPLSLRQIRGFTEVDSYLMHDKGKCWGRDKRGIQPEGSPPQRTILAADWLSACWEGLSCKNTIESTEEPQIFMSIPN